MHKLEPAPQSPPRAGLARHLQVCLLALAGLVLAQSTLAKFYCRTADYLLFIVLLALAWLFCQRLLSGLRGVLASLSILHVLALALCLRLAWIFLVQPENYADQIIYKKFAIAIASGQLCFDPWYSLGCSYFFAPFVFLFGTSDEAIRVPLAILSTAQVWLLHRLARSWLGPMPAIAGALLLALYPENIYAVTMLNGDVPYATLTFAAVCLVMVRDPGPRWWQVVLAGMCLGLANGIRSTTILYGAAIVIFLLFIQSATLTTRARRLVLLGAAFWLGASPFIALNYASTGVMSLTPQQTGMLHLYIGLNPHTSGSDTVAEFREYFDLIKKAGAEGHPQPQLAAEDILREELIPRRLRQHWPEILYMMFLRKPVKLWGHPMIAFEPLHKSRLENSQKLVTTVAFVFHRLVLALALLGLWRAWRSNQPGISLYATLPCLIILATTAFHMVFVVVPRYHHMVLPLLVLLACIPLAARSKPS